LAPSPTAASLHPRPAAQDSYVDRERKAKGLVAHLRFEAGRNPYDRNLSGLIGELSTRSPEFRTRASVVQVTGYPVAGGINDPLRSASANVNVAGGGGVDVRLPLGRASCAACCATCAATAGRACGSPSPRSTRRATPAARGACGS